MSDNLLNKLTQLKLPAMAGSLIRQRETPAPAEDEQMPGDRDILHDVLNF